LEEVHDYGNRVIMSYYLLLVCKRLTPLVLELEEIFLGRLGVSGQDTTGVEMIERLDRRRCRAHAR
jgi:hypothetical protein